MALLSLFVELVAAIFTCGHARSRVVEGKTFCPDCGQGVVFQWVVLRCKGCNQRRPCRYALRKVVPSQMCCTYCGDQEIQTQVLHEPEYFQLHYALLSYQTDVEELSWDIRLSTFFTALVKEAVINVQAQYTDYPRLPVHQSSSLSY